MYVFQQVFSQLSLSFIRLHSDYRGLKKRITACRREKERENGKRPASPQLDSHAVTTRSQAGRGLQPEQSSSLDLGGEVATENSQLKDITTHEEPASVIQSPPTAITRGFSSQDDLNGPAASSSQIPSVADNQAAQLSPTPHLVPTPRRSRDSSNAAEIAPPQATNRANTVNMGMLPKLHRRSTFRLPSSLKRGGAGRWELSRNPKLPWDPTKPISLAELMPLLTSETEASPPVP